MTGRTKAYGMLAAVLVAGALSGCFFDDEEACDSVDGLSAAPVANGCVDTSDNECISDRQPGAREIRVDSYDIRLPSGEWVRSEGADLGSKPPLVTLAVGKRAGDDDATTTALSVGQPLDPGASTYRVAAFCDTGVAWLVAIG